MKKSFRIASKYLITKSGFFSTQQLVLSLQEQYLQMQPLSSDREEKDGGVTRIEWDSIISVTASDRNPKEFTLLVLPSSYKKKSGAPINKANAQQQIYQCKERNRLMTEIIHKLHIFNDDGKPYLVEKAWHQPDIYKQTQKKKVSIRIHPSIIQVVAAQSAQFEIKDIPSIQPTGNYGQSKFQPGPTHQKKEEEEVKRKLFEDFGTEQKSQPFIQDSVDQELLFEEEDDDDDLLNEYESEGVGNLLTPYKGSMLGGTILGEESNLQSNMVQHTGGNELLTSQSLIKQHFIYLSEIDRICSYQNILVIVKKNQDIEKFFMRNEEKTKEVINMIKKNQFANLKLHLKVQSYQSFEQEKLIEDLEFLKKEGKICYSQDVASFTWDGLVSGIQIQLDETSIYEVDKMKEKVRKSCLLKDLEMIRINDKSSDYNLVLLFKKETEMVLYIPNILERERLVSAILTLRQFLIPTTGYIDQLSILINSPLDFSLKIFGHDQFEQQQYVQEYEGLLLRKLNENINYKDNAKINNIIEEAMMNASFANLIKIDQKILKAIINDITQTLQQYIQFELFEPQVVDHLLRKYIEDMTIDFLQFRQKKKSILLQDKSLFGLGAVGEGNSHQIVNDNSNQVIQPVQTMQFNMDEAQPEKARQYEILFERVSKYMNVLTQFLNSKTFLIEMQEHEDLMMLLIKLLGSKSPYMSFLSSQVIKAMIQHYSNNESKTESLNKKILIRGKQQNTQSGQETYGNFLSTFDQNGESNYQLIQAIREYLLYYEDIYERQNIVKSLHLFSLQNILRSILVTRKNSTAKEELKLFADMITEDDVLIKQVLEEEAIQSNRQSKLIQSETTNPGARSRKKQKKTEDLLDNKPMFHLVDKFSLLGFEYFDVQYFFTMILNETFGYYKKYETDKLWDLQNYVQNYSVQFVWQLYLQMESLINEQKKMSIHTLSKLLYQNSDGIHLLLRCYPKTLIDKVDTHQDLVSMLWQESEWNNFFLKITQKNFDSAIEQWNDETREELKQRLQSELQEFLEAQRIHKQVMADDTKRELVLPNHEFNRDKKVFSRLKNLKWNYMEFQVKYKSLNNKYLVWKYYLSKLLIENNLEDMQRPRFSIEKIDKPQIFWQELKIRFMSSFDPQEQIIILKTLCILYNKNYTTLKELKTLPYLLKLFQQQQYEHCHFILLQLIHVALSIDKEVSIKNMRKFIKNDGLPILFNQMKLAFKELLRPDRNKKVLLLSSIYQKDNDLQNIEGILQDQANYTTSDTNSVYFRRNSEFICMGILSLKILNLIFREMYQIDSIPLPTNREYLLQPTSLAILSQMLMIENVDLTRELTLFILSHMNNHYSFFKLKNSGMIEFLLLCLSTKNGDRSLDILQKFQEVAFDYNTNIKLGLYTANDLQMLQDDRAKIAQALQIQFNQPTISQLNPQQTGGIPETPFDQEIKKYSLLAESLFLRFLPIPFIKFLYEHGQQKFLEVYKQNFYESPILIWNAELRQILEDNIREHATAFIEKLQQFANQKNQDIKQSESFPIYDKKFKNIIKYPSLDNEVRCGRYYLRVWVNQKKKSASFFDIPQEEETEFRKNLMIEMMTCQDEDKQQDLQKIIILFKAYLLTLQRFQKKRQFKNSMDQKQQILSMMMSICNQNIPYNSTVQELIYLGMKIIYEIADEQNNYDNQITKINIVTFKDNIDDQYTKSNVKIIAEVLNFILKNSFSSSSAPPSDENEKKDLLMNQPTVTRIEVKTLALCVKSFNIMLNDNVFAYVDIPLMTRINLFKQISRVLDLSFFLQPLFKDKQLRVQSNQYESGTFSTLNAQNVLKARGKSKQKKNATKQKKNKLMQGNGNNNQQSRRDQSQNQRQQIGTVLTKPLPYAQQFPGLEDKKTIKTEVKSRNKVYQKDNSIDYNSQLLKIILEKMDKYSIEMIIDLSRSIFELTKEMSQKPMLHPEIIASGLAWKSLKYIYFQLKEEIKHYQDLKVSIKDAVITLKNMISASRLLAQTDAENFAFKKLTNQLEKDIIQNFWACIKTIFGNKILGTIISDFEINNNDLIFGSYDPRKFLSLFSVKEEASPELVWNNETRLELFQILEQQIQQVNNMDQCFDKILLFNYKVNQRELKVEDIFIRYFNSQQINRVEAQSIRSQLGPKIMPTIRYEYRPPDIEYFASKLIDRLKEFIELKVVGDLTQEEIQNCLELLKAFKILLIYENLTINDKDQFEDYINYFCTPLQLKQDNESENQQLELKMFKEYSELVLDILNHMTRFGGLHFELLKDNHDFIKLLIRSLYGKEKDIISTQQIITIIQNMIGQKDLELIKGFLVNTGLIMFVLNQIFEKKTSDQQLKETIQFVKILLDTSQITSQIYSKFIPAYFFVEIQQKANNDPGTEKIIDFLQNLKKNEFENVFIIWNSTLRNQSHQRIKKNCENIIRSYEDSNYQFDWDLGDLQNPLLDSEKVVSNVIIRIFNKNPSEFINSKLNSFILNLCQEIQQVASQLFKIGQQQDIQNYGVLIAKNESQAKALCKQSILLLTSLLLSIEQLLSNEYNPNRHMVSKKDEKKTDTKFYMIMVEKATDQTQLDNKVYQILGFLIQTQVFLSRLIPVEIRITFLQIIYLIIDVSDAIKALKDNQCLMQFITDSISGIIADRYQKTIEEAFILLITHRMQRKDTDSTRSLITDILDKLLKIHEKKKKLRKLVEIILCQMAQDSQYKDSIINTIKQNSHLKIDTKGIYEGRIDQDLQDAILKLWRGRPSGVSDVRRYYDFNEVLQIEDKLDETNIPKLRLPLLSKKSIMVYKKDELFYDEEAKKDTRIRPQININNDQMGGMYSGKGSNDNILGYQPIFNTNMLNVPEIEPIEKQHEDFHSDDELQDP